MFDKKLLITGKLPVLKTKLLDDTRRDYFQNPQKDCAEIQYDIFIKKIEQHFKNNSQNNLTGFDGFTHKDIIMGCQHYIDNLIAKHGLANLQIFEHDYHYYKTINPQIKYTTLDELDPKKPLLIAFPFPGHLGPHRQMNQILEKCNLENIEVHLDCSWLVSAFDITFNFDQPCIKSIAMSFSKAYALHWNKVGLRWSREKDVTDSITFLNEAEGIPKTLLSVADYFMDRLPIDYVCRTFKEKYFRVCKALKLRPGNVIHACFSIDRKILYGLKNFFN
jgi:hypothetical protein